MEAYGKAAGGNTSSNATPEAARGWAADSSLTDDRPAVHKAAGGKAPGGAAASGTRLPQLERSCWGAGRRRAAARAAAWALPGLPCCSTQRPNLPERFRGAASLHCCGQHCTEAVVQDD
jgi:hypothetical protein